MSIHVFCSTTNPQKWFSERGWRPMTVSRSLGFLWLVSGKYGAYSFMLILWMLSWSLIGFKTSKKGHWGDFMWIYGLLLFSLSWLQHPDPCCRGSLQVKRGIITAHWQKCSLVFKIKRIWTQDAVRGLDKVKSRPKEHLDIYPSTLIKFVCFFSQSH